MPGITQSLTGTLGIDGNGSPNLGGFIPVNLTYNASSVDASGFVAAREYQVASIIGCVTAAGTDGSAVTAAVKKAPSGTAIASGTALHSGTFDLKGTANTNQSLTVVTTTDAIIAAGERIGLDFTGTLTTATGTITVLLVPR